MAKTKKRLLQRRQNISRTLAGIPFFKRHCVRKMTADANDVDKKANPITEPRTFGGPNIRQLTAPPEENAISSRTRNVSQVM